MIEEECDDVAVEGEGVLGEGADEVDVVSEEGVCIRRGLFSHVDGVCIRESYD